MIKSEVLEKLKIDDEYYGKFGKQFLSNSDIQNLLGNPRDFGKSLDPHPNLIKGGYFHQLILEPDKARNVPIVDASSRNTKIYKDFVKEHRLDIAMLAYEGLEIRECVSAMTSNLEFYEGIRQDGNRYEVPAVKEIKGKMWKGKADIVCTDKLIDLKTTSDINKFKWSARNYNYDSQCYIYEQLFGLPLFFYVVDKKTKMLGIYTPTEEFLKRGEEKVEQAVENYDKFFGDNPTEDIESYYIKEDLF